MGGLAVGQKVEDFVLPDQGGKAVSFYNDVLSKGPVLVVFYPGDFTMVCTKQLCNYRDNISSFQNFGIQIVGISKNSVEDHAHFAQEYSFPFTLLSDHDKNVARLFGTASLLSLGGISRAVFIVSKLGYVVYRYVEPTNLMSRKSNELLEIIKDLRQKGQI